MPRVFGFRNSSKDETTLSNSIALKKSTSKDLNKKPKVGKRGRFGGFLRKDESHDATSIISHLGSSETISSSSEQGEGEVSPSSFRISVLDVRQEEQQQEISTCLVPPLPKATRASRTSPGRRGRGRSISPLRRRRSSTNTPVAAAAAASGSARGSARGSSPQRRLRRSSAASSQRTTPRSNVKQHVRPPPEHPLSTSARKLKQQLQHSQQRQPSPVRNFMKRRMWRQGSSDTGEDSKTNGSPRRRSLSFGDGGRGRKTNNRSTTHHHTAASTVDDFDIQKARNSFSLTDNLMSSNDYLRRTLSLATSRNVPGLASKNKYSFSGTAIDMGNDVPNKGDGGGGVVEDSLGEYVMNVMGFRENSILAGTTNDVGSSSRSLRNQSANTATTAPPRTRRQRVDDILEEEAEEKHASDSEESMVLLEDNGLHVPEPPTLPRIVEDSPVNTKVRFSDRVLCFADGGSVASSLQEPPSLTGCLGSSSSRSKSAPTLNDPKVPDGRPAKKSHDFSLFGELDDLFYDVTFFCRCMGEAFEEAGGLGNDSIARNPSMVETSGESHRATITSAMKPNPHYSPPRRPFGAAASSGTSSPSQSPSRSIGSFESYADSATYSAGTGSQSSRSEFS